MFINNDKCVGIHNCGVCQNMCPVKGIDISYHITKDVCIECGMCYEVCPVGAIIKSEENITSVNSNVSGSVIQSISSKEQKLKDALAWAICYGGTAMVKQLFLLLPA